MQLAKVREGVCRSDYVPWRPRLRGSPVRAPIWYGAWVSWAKSEADVTLLSAVAIGGTRGLFSLLRGDSFDS